MGTKRVSRDSAQAVQDLTVADHLRQFRRQIVVSDVEEEERELFPEVEKAIGADELETMGTEMEARFDELLAKGHATILPANYDQTSADVAQAEAAE